MSRDDFDFSTSGLDAILKALKTASKQEARVGILGGKSINSREDGGETNAQIGAKHEFGGPTTLPSGKEIMLPARSFLRVPITEHLQKYLDKSGAFKPEVLREVMREETVVPWLHLVAISAEAIVLDAFQTGGFGKWKASNMKFKKNHQTLVETTQLRDSITSEVK